MDPNSRFTFLRKIISLGALGKLSDWLIHRWWLRPPAAFRVFPDHSMRTLRSIQPFWELLRLWILIKVSLHENQSKIYIADFGNFKQGFLIMKLIQNSNFRVQGMLFSTIVLYYNCITPISGNHVHAFHTIQPSYLLAYMQPYLS